MPHSRGWRLRHGSCKGAMRNYSFRPLTPDDLPLMRRWLQMPHVRAWWGDVDRNLKLMQQDMDNKAINMQVVELSGMPFAYLHHHDVQAFAMPQFAELAYGTRALNTFVGEPDYLGQGHAAGYVGACVEDLRTRYPMAAAAPNSTDARQINIYTKAGFRKRRLAPTRDGKLVQVMTHS